MVLSFMAPESSLAFDDAHEMRDLGDHAAGGRRIGDFCPPTDPVKAKPDKGLALIGASPDGAGDLFERDCLGVAHGLHLSIRNPQRRLRRPGGATATSRP